MMVRTSLAFMPIVPKGTAIPDISDNLYRDKLDITINDKNLYIDLEPVNDIDQKNIDIILTSYRDRICKTIKPIIDDNYSDLTSNIYLWIDSIYIMYVKTDFSFGVFIDKEVGEPDKNTEKMLEHICNSYLKMMLDARESGDFDEDDDSDTMLIILPIVDILVRNQPSFTIKI